MAVLVDDDGSDNRIEADRASIRGDVDVELRGRRNLILIGDGLQTDHSLRIRVHGDDNVVTLGEGIYFLGARETFVQRSRIVVFGNRNRVAMGRGCSGSFGMRINADDAEVTLGEHCTAIMARIQVLEQASIALGDDCMLSADVVFQVSDGHPIFDRATGARINPAQDIRIGDHVWLGVGVRILKGADVGSGSVIGAESVVTQSITANCIAAGVPARVVRENIEWRRNERQFCASAKGTLDR